MIQLWNKIIAIPINENYFEIESYVISPFVFFVLFIYLFSFREKERWEGGQRERERANLKQAWSEPKSSGLTDWATHAPPELFKVWGIHYILIWEHVKEIFKWKRQVEKQIIQYDYRYVDHTHSHSLSLYLHTCIYIHTHTRIYTYMYLCSTCVRLCMLRKGYNNL